MRLIEPNGTKDNGIDIKLDELLVLWHQWRSSYTVEKGFAGRDSTCRDYRAPTHWDWKNGALEGRIEMIEVKAVGDAIERIPNTPQRWQTALSFEARNLACCAAVWSSPVLPKNKDERDVLILEARNMLFIELRKAGFFS